MYFPMMVLPLDGSILLNIISALPINWFGRNQNNTQESQLPRIVCKLIEHDFVSQERWTMPSRRTVRRKATNTAWRMCGNSCACATAEPDAPALVLGDALPHGGVGHCGPSNFSHILFPHCVVHSGFKSVTHLHPGYDLKRFGGNFKVSPRAEAKILREEDSWMAKKCWECGQSVGTAVVRIYSWLHGRSFGVVISIINYLAWASWSSIDGIDQLVQNNKTPQSECEQKFYWNPEIV